MLTFALVNINLRQNFIINTKICIIMKSKSIKGSTFCLFMLLMNICIWLVLYFFLVKDVAVRGCYQGKLAEVLEQISEDDAQRGESLMMVKRYQNDDALPQFGDVVTAVKFVGEDDVLFYKGEIHEQTLIDERVQTNRQVSNVFMGVFCTVFAILYLTCRAEEKRAQKAFVSDN